MEVTQRIIQSVDTDIDVIESLLAQPADIILVFASPTFFSHPTFLDALSQHHVPVVGCSASGEIAGADALEGTAVITVLDLQGAGTTRVFLDSVDNNHYHD